MKVKRIEMGEKKWKLFNELKKKIWDCDLQNKNKNKTKQKNIEPQYSRIGSKAPNPSLLCYSLFFEFTTI